MSHNEEHVRCILIGACSSAASSAMDAAAIEVNRGTPGGSKVEIFPGTRGARSVSGEERDRMAEATIAEIRQRHERLAGLYPCEGRGRDLDAVTALENE